MLRDESLRNEYFFLLFFTKQKQQNIKQESHSNAVTNLHISSQIKKSSLINFELTDMFNFSCTINEWKSREELEGKRKLIPHKIKYLVKRTNHELSFLP